ncbi:hypothetical protein PC110_g22057 [Phytophthora cactorum]|uniref:MULE transposase domain-containing protein n=1 Tax=Phytophthora cactorum TaxID=29920 RepID=A0A329RAI5_9STRA|nr:hypothetical protein PC110_g22057 [Phytophthora cactorum]
MANMNTVLPIAQCWLPGEAEEDFTWALTKLQQLMVATEVGQPSVVIADRDQACMNAIGHLFPEVSSLVCRWHMNRNVLAKTRTVGQVEIVNPVLSQDKYENTVATDYFMELFYIAVDSSTETAFEENLVKIRSKRPQGRARAGRVGVNEKPVVEDVETLDHGKQKQVARLQELLYSSRSVLKERRFKVSRRFSPCSPLT